MTEITKLNHPWLVAVWPGMGNVAISAGFYLMSKLDMHVEAEYESADLFDVDHVEVKDGIIQPGRRPRNRFFVWKDPKQQRDIVVFIGEAQPPMGKYPFCRKIIDYAQQLGIEQIFTFAAMATQMHPEHPSRVFAAAIDADSLEELKNRDLQILESGQISGLNGVLLGVAAESNMRGACLLGEMPHIFHQLSFPKAALSVLEVFTELAEIELDFAELAEQSKMMEQQLGELLSEVEQKFGKQLPVEEEEEATPEPKEEKIRPTDRNRIERLFQQAEKDRTKAFELKQVLDHLGIFKEYEDRFLDLFKK